MFHYRFDRKANTVFTTLTGPLNDADLVAHAKEVFGDDAIQPQARALVDFQGVTQFHVTSVGVRAVAELFAAGSPIARTAFVARSDAIFGMSRMYEMLRGEDESSEIRVFRNLEEAREWLGLD